MATTTSATSTPAATTQTAATTTTNYNYSASTEDIDWNALVEVAVAAKQTRAVTIDRKIDANEASIAAYDEMQSLLQGVVDAASSIRGSDNSLIEKDGIFSQRAAYLTSVGNVNAEAAVVVTAEPDATITTYDLKILQLATAQKIASADVADNLTDLGFNGTFNIGLDTVEPVEVTIEEDMTLDEIAEAINIASEKSGVSATVVKVTESSYKLILSGNETGQNISMTAVSGDDIAEELGLTDSNGIFVNELQASQASIINLDGVEITRSTNQIDDLIDGVAFSIYQETGEANSVAVEISNDLGAIKQTVTDVVEAYNAYREWAITQQAVTAGGNASDEAVLFADSTLRSANTAIADALSTVIDKESMAFLGLSYDTSNMLVLDETELNDALLSDLDIVEDILTFKMDASSTDIAILNRPANMPEDLKLDITVDNDGNLASASVDGDSSLFTISDSRIQGAEGSIYEGITFVFTGNKSQSIDMTFSSGIAEKLYSAIDIYSNEEGGLLEGLMSSLTDTNDDLLEDSTEIKSRAESYRSTLAARYSRYQAAIAEAESTLSYLEALLNTGND
ncbi:flagellar filament capping protein FliD [Roseibium algae]|uniref:Flagellar hook-associated protein 2 n=1 Tax=Roseibium algae TaxID=3123038 RepID=A0ABU8TEJ6_9HYPH